MSAMPSVLLAILAKQKEPMLPTYLRCIELLDYPKDRISLYVRTNNNTDRTEMILREWLTQVGPRYASVDFDAGDVVERVEAFGVHEWNPVRFKVLAAIRQASLRRATELGCGFYFVVDVDNFVRPLALRRLVELDLPIVAPMLRHVNYPSDPYSNWHDSIDSNGYYAPSPDYGDVLARRRCGVREVPVVHCTYLVRSDVVDRLRYDDGSARYEYVVFSDSARRARVPQYIDNRCDYGVLTLDEHAPTLDWC